MSWILSITSESFFCPRRLRILKQFTSKLDQDLTMSVWLETHTHTQPSHQFLQGHLLLWPLTHTIPIYKYQAKFTHALQAKDDTTNQSSRWTVFSPKDKNKQTSLKLGGPLSLCEAHQSNRFFCKNNPIPLEHTHYPTLWVAFHKPIPLKYRHTSPNHIQRPHCWFPPPPPMLRQS